MSRKFFQRHDVVTAVVAGLAYGVVTQLAGRMQVFAWLFAIMSFGYVFFMPMVLGFVTGLSLRADRSLWFSVLAAWGTSLLSLAVAFAVGWEGSLCLIMAAPVYLLFSALGAIVGYKQRKSGGSGRARRLAVGLGLFLPLGSAAVESAVPSLVELREVHNSIDIAASPTVVWPHIARVSKITEPQQSFFFTMGFPRPVEATLSFEGVGGVRHASFERGLLFIETVTLWQPPHALAFSIAVDPDHTPLTTMDAHVTVGGRYFDVLEGTYRIEPRAEGQVRLHLVSKQRISTRFNFYTALWSDYLMSEIQQNILRVLKQRCERVARR